jgi:hypothetical protein
LRTRETRIPKPKILPHLLRPARFAAAAVIIVFSLILSIALHGGLMGIPATFIVTSWFFKYAYILFDHTVWGYDEPPTLDIQMLNPLNEQRPLAQVVILGLIYAAVKFVETAWGAAAAGVLVAIAAFTFPASVAVLGLERNILLAIYPVALARMIRGLGLVYLLVLLVIGAYLAGITVAMKWLSFLPLELALAMFGILSIFSVLGGALYERRSQLGIDVRRSPERTAELARQAELREHHALVTDAYGQMRVGSHTKAWALLQDWLASRGHAIADYRWLLDHVAHWHDRRYSNRLTEEYLEKLVTLKDYGRALDVLRLRLDHDPSFRPKTAAATLQLAELAAQGGGLPRIARILVADFPTRFPDHPGVSAARALGEQLGR